MAAIGTVSAFLTRGGVVVNLGGALDTNEAWIETKAFGQDDIVHFIDRLIYNVSNRQEQTNLVVELYGSDDENEGFELLDTIDIFDNDPGYTDPPGKRYYRLKFIDRLVGDRWRLHGFTVFGEAGGDEF